MEQSTAQRRLVKSPPELWAEVSCEDALGRRLAQFGEIRITRLEPETTVAWEGERASGTVELAPAGWGTKVVLTAKPAGRPPAAIPTPKATPAPVRAASAVERRPEPAAAPVEPAPARLAAALAPEPAAAPVEPAPARAATEPARVAAEPAPAPEPAAVQPPPPRPEEPATPPASQERKLGFFARLFRRQEAEPAPVAYRFPPSPDPVHAPEAPAATPPPTSPEPSQPALGPEPTPPEPDPAPTLPRPAAAPAADAGLDSERTVAILTEVLDDLGAAHHRPFSRDELS